LISGPDLAREARLLSFIPTQTTVVFDLLIGHNALRRHSYRMGLSNNQLVGNVVLRRKSQSTFCVNVRPGLHSDIHIWVPSFWTQRILGKNV
jgi:hypothetical protein